MPNTKKGKDFVEACLKDMVYEERSVDEAIDGNSQLKNPSPKHKKHDKFMKLYEKYGYERECKRTRTFKQFLKSIKLVNSIYYKIKGRQ
jgi:hypothetical protein